MAIPTEADVRLEVEGELPIAEWIYALVAPFPTLADGMSYAALRGLWSGESPTDARIFLTPQTMEALSIVMGPPRMDGLFLAEQADLLDRAWRERPSFALVPFEALEARWKVLELDGQSPIRKDFEVASYPLRLEFGLSGDSRAVETLAKAIEWPKTNRRSNQITVLVMTGVTALVRATALRMERHGVEYPGEGVAAWLQEADFAHVSNEVAFAAECPPPDPFQKELRFCSAPSYVGLLDELGVDLVELTGNHILDWGVQPFLDTLAVYRDRGWRTIGGGVDLADALTPARLEHNGNRLAIFGCNSAGPPSVWAAPEKPGNAPCSHEAILAQVALAREQGEMPIVTMQWTEFYSSTPLPMQAQEFRRAAQAGAVAVIGSQAHQPQSIEFSGGTFIHYGLGNLFFDQMDELETREEFIDRLVFYDGRLIGVELLTAILEDYARPRPMTPEERADFLERIFAASGWLAGGEAQGGSMASP
ncbi:MAG TPA: CapA family protein [Anaerolineales bacterium]|nr:CapA family protein [Anaerolineales bacterium]